MSNPNMHRTIEHHKVVHNNPSLALKQPRCSLYKQKIKMLAFMEDHDRVTCS